LRPQTAPSKRCPTTAAKPLILLWEFFFHYSFMVVKEL
jgi:hypothetical protein